MIIFGKAGGVTKKRNRWRGRAIEKRRKGREK